MSEKILNNEQLLQPERSKLVVESSLERPDGSKAEFGVELLADGKPKALAFFDVDKTLVHLDPVYKEAIHELFPQDVDLDHGLKIYKAGFQLGSSWAEMVRMRGIYLEGKKHWEDSKVFETERFQTQSQREEVNLTGSELHAIADGLLHQFDEIASQVIGRQYESNPQSFEKAKIQPIYHLTEIYKRLGVPMVCMSANPGKFIKSVCKYMGLADYFIEAASDWDVEGDKEHKIDYLVERLKAKGLPIPYDRMIIVGDSIKGDIGAGWRYKDRLHDVNGNGPVDVKGVLVVDDEQALAAAEAKVANEPELQTMLESFEVEAFNLSKVTYSPQGTPNIGGQHRKGFLSHLKNKA